MPDASFVNLQSILNVIEIIKEIKLLLAVQNPYLPVYSALGGAFVGAVSAFIPNYLISKCKERSEKRSTTLQLYAEIKSILELIKLRQYVEAVTNIVNELKQGGKGSYQLQIQFQEERFVVYRNNLPKLGLIDYDLQLKIVEFYMLLEAIIQDVKPGGILNTMPGRLFEYENILNITIRAVNVADSTVRLIEDRYRFLRHEFRNNQQ